MNPSKQKLLSLIIFSSLVSALFAQDDNCPEFGPFCSCKYSEILMECTGFDSFDQLNFNPTNTNEPITLFELELEPKNKIMLDNSLDLKNLVITDDVKLRNIFGFSYEQNPFRRLKQKPKNLYLYESNLDFYIAKNGDWVLLDSKECSSSNTILGLQTTIPLFASFNAVVFDYDLVYPNEMCPFIFRNADLRLLKFEKIHEEQVVIVNFININPNAGSIININSNIESLIMYDLEIERLDAKILNPNVFMNLKYLDIDYCLLGSIEDTVFASLKSLKKMTLTLTNFDKFMYSANTKNWMKNLNGDVRVNLNNKTEIELKKNEQFLLEFDNRYEDDSVYSFEDSELCKFKDFPHDKLVFPRIFSRDNLPCSKTIKWLLKYYRNYKDFEQLNTQGVGGCLAEIGEPADNQPPKECQSDTTTKSSNGFKVNSFSLVSLMAIVVLGFWMKDI